MTRLASLLLFLLVTFAGCQCNKPDCTAGQPGCACRAANSCDEGAVCGPDGVCAAPGFVSLVVSDPAARGCEVLLTEGAGATVALAKFDSTAVGTFLREAPRVAVTFVAANDAAFSASGAQLGLTAGQASGLTVTKATCVDAKGAVLPNATVSLR